MAPPQRLAFFVSLIFAFVSCGRLVAGDEELATGEEHVHRIVRRQIVSDRTPLNRTLRIATIHHDPYTIITNLDGGRHKYVGFIPDMVDALAKQIRFAYEFYPVTGYGMYNNETGTWSGLIGEVLKRDKSETEGADMAAAAITITSGRERVVDFLKPFQHLGVSVVVKRPDVSQASVDMPFTFGIFQPLQPTVWALVIAAVVVVGLFLWLMNMFNPYEWAGRYGVGLADQQHAELFNLPGSLWFAFTTLQWQGFERAPRSLAAKFLTCVWFAFVTIVLVTYTAGIVNHLYWASMAHKSVSARPRFVDLAHIVSSNDMKYGTIANSQTYRYMMDVAVGEEFDIIRRYWQTEEGRAQLVSSVDEGLKRVRDGNYAFIMESLSAKFSISQRPCDLTTVGETMGSRSYGFALPEKATPQWLMDELHLAVLEMYEQGDIEALERRWFSDRDQCWNVTRAERLVSEINNALYVDQPKSVDVTMFAGPLILVMVGLALSVLIALAEMMYYRYRGRHKASNEPQSQQLRMEPDEGNI
jgi:ABC-type amino acid transport substrate-binding protein